MGRLATGMALLLSLAVSATDIGSDPIKFARISDIHSAYAALREYDLEHIDADTRPHMVTVNVHMDAEPFKRHQDEILASLAAYFDVETHTKLMLRYSVMPQQLGRDTIDLRVVETADFARVLPPGVRPDEFYGFGDFDHRVAYVHAHRTLRDLEGVSSQLFVGASQEIMAHEISHVLGLIHVDDIDDGCFSKKVANSQNLMVDTMPTFDIARPLHLQPKEVDVMLDYLNGGKVYSLTGGDHPDFRRYAKMAQSAIAHHHLLSIFEGNCSCATGNTIISTGRVR